MRVIVSCHMDTVFKDPYAIATEGKMWGANDNVAGMMVAAQILDLIEDLEEGDESIKVHFTEDEEMYMDGARYVARHNDLKTDFIVVLDITEAEENKEWKGINFTVENYHGITDKHIKKALRGYGGKYKVMKDGEEDEAWLYKQLGYACLSLCVPVYAGQHNLDSYTYLKDIAKAGAALRAVIKYISDKTREELGDYVKPGQSNGNGD